MPCVSYCDEALSPHVQVDCDDFKLGGISGAVLFACGSEPTDPTSGSEVSAIIEAGNAVLIQGTRIGIPAGSPVTVTSAVACGTDDTVNYDRTATLFDANLNAANDVFYNIANRRKFGAAIFYNCDAGDAFYVNPPSGIRAQVSPVVTDQNTEYRRYEGLFAWRDLNIPLLTTAPSGVFG
jgi:hypothetical protein